MVSPGPPGQFHILSLPTARSGNHFPQCTRGDCKLGAVSSRVREDHLKSDLDQRSRSDKWSRSFFPKDHLKREDQDRDQDHLKRSLCCTKDRDIYCVISHIMSHWWVLKSVFQIMLKIHLFITILLKLVHSEGPFFGILGMHTKWSHGKIKGKWI